MTTIITTTTAAPKAMKRARENLKCHSSNTKSSTTTSTKNYFFNENMSLHMITPPSSSKAIFRSERELYPTIYVQADTGSFIQVVQFLTGLSQLTFMPDQEIRFVLSPKKAVHREQAFDLYEGRNISDFKSINLMINTPMYSSSVDLPKSDSVRPVTPLSKDVSDNVYSCYSSLYEEEEKAIAEKGFYLHPSPTARYIEPRLLPLFPVSSSQGFSSTC